MLKYFVKNLHLKNLIFLISFAKNTSTIIIFLSVKSFFFYFLIEAITKKEEQKRGGNKRLELGFDDGMGRQINAIRVKMLFIIFKNK